MPAGLHRLTSSYTMVPLGLLKLKSSEINTGRSTQAMSIGTLVSPGLHGLCLTAPVPSGLRRLMFSYTATTGSTETDVHVY